MPAFNSFNLADQGRNGVPNVTTNYYTGLNRPTPVGNQLGNNNAINYNNRPPNLTGTVSPTSGAPGNTTVGTPPTSANNSRYVMGNNGVRYDKTTGWAEYQDPNGQWVRFSDQQTGANSRRDPRLYGSAGYVGDSWDSWAQTPEAWESQMQGRNKNLFNVVEGEHAGDSPTKYKYYELRPEVKARLGNRVQLNQLGQGGYHEVIDPSKVEWDDEFGLVTTQDNIGAPDRKDTGLTRAMPFIVAAALGAPVAAHAAWAAGAEGLGASGWEALGPGDGMTPPGGWTPPAVDVPPPMNPVTPTGGSGVPTLPTTTPPAVDIPPPMNTLPPTPTPTLPTSGTPIPPAVDVPPPLPPVPNTGGAGIPNLSPPPNLTGSALPWGRVAGNLAGGVANYYLGRRAENSSREAANRADTWGQDGREWAKKELLRLMEDPSSIENTPGYQFARSQGEQGINRAAAGKGYFRSPNMLFDLSKFNQELASKTWNDEWNKYAKMAGLDFNPADASKIQATGAQQGTSMRAAGLTQFLGAGGSIWDYLFG